MRVTARIAVVGAGSMQGREIAEELAQSDLAAAQLVLLDDEDHSGELTQVGDEPTVVMAVEAESFEGVDVAIFATPGPRMAEQMDAARRSGSGVVDATGGAGTAPVRASLVSPAAPLELTTTTVIAAHAAATMMARVLAQMPEIQSASATVLLPVSEGGRAAMDELQQQAVNLLAFQSVPTDVFGTQVAFNLLPRFSDEITLDLVALADRIARQTKALLGRLMTLQVQVVQVPTFVGVGIALFAAGEITAAPGIELATEDEPATILSVAGTPLVRVQPQGHAGAFLVADNLKLTAQNCVHAATELLRLRPRGKVQ